MVTRDLFSGTTMIVCKLLFRETELVTFPSVVIFVYIVLEVLNKA